MHDPSMHSPTPSDSTPPAPSRAEPLFPRQRWHVDDPGLNRFFDAFVPAQYENGFAWRCRMIQQGQEKRLVPFDEQSAQAKIVIAANAELLLELYEETPVAQLDQMREAGRHLMVLGIFNPNNQFHADLYELRNSMARAHHEKWWQQFRKDLAAGKRHDRGHPGNVAFEDLPPMEVLIMKVQTWGNWRILAAMSDGEYIMIRDLAAKRTTPQ